MDRDKLNSLPSRANTRTRHATMGHACGRCQQIITKDDYKTKKVIVSNRVPWHKQCVRCQICKFTAQHRYFKCNVPGVPGGFVCQCEVPDRDDSEVSHRESLDEYDSFPRDAEIKETPDYIPSRAVTSLELNAAKQKLSTISPRSSRLDVAREKRGFTKCIVCSDILGKFPVTYMHTSTSKGAHIIHEKCKEQYEEDYMNGVCVKGAKCAKCDEDYLPAEKNKWCVGGGYDYRGESSLKGLLVHKCCVVGKCSICDKMIGSKLSYMVSDDTELIHDACAPFYVPAPGDINPYSRCSYAVGNKKFDLGKWWPSVVSRKTFPIFPREFRATIFTVLLSRKRQESPIRVLTNDVLWQVIFQMLRNPNDYKIQNGLDVNKMCLNTRCCQQTKCFCGNDFQYTFEEKATACSPKIQGSEAVSSGKCLYYDFHCTGCEKNIEYGADSYKSCTKYRCYRNSSCAQCGLRIAPNKESEGCHWLISAHHAGTAECSTVIDRIENLMDVLVMTVDFDVISFNRKSPLTWYMLPDKMKRTHLVKFIREEMEKGKYSSEKLEEITRLLLK